MNENELMDGLRELRGGEPREAPRHVEERLLAEFRKRSGRRQSAWWQAGVIGAIAAGIAALVWLAGVTANRAPHTVAELRPEAAVLESVAEEDTSDFYPLPAAEALPAVETAMVVRVELPMSSLRLMGYPVNEEPSGEPVQADVLLGQDGLARGVRVVE